MQLADTKNVFEKIKVPFFISLLAMLLGVIIAFGTEFIRNAPLTANNQTRTLTLQADISPTVAPATIGGTSKSGNLFDRFFAFIQGKKATPTPRPLPTAGPTVIPLLLTKPNTTGTEQDFQFIKDQTLRKQAVAQVNVTAYQATIDEKDIDTQTISEFQKTDTTVNKSTRVLQKGKELSSLIRIGTTMYVKDYSDDTWWKQNIALIPDNPHDINNFSNLSLQNPSEKYTALGEQPCGQHTCLQYQEKSTVSNAVQRTLIFDKDTLLLYQEKTGADKFETVTSYEYPNITITPPSKTKSVPESKNIFDYYKPISRYSFVRK